jgi:NTE family protein
MRTLNLALQGGGSHGAFTWGVLDALLADPRISLEGLSGTSAGAVNAVALASGYAKGLAAGTDPRRAARDSLARIWDQVAAWGTLGSLQQRFGSMLWGGLPAELAPTNLWANAVRGMFSPYQSNPLDINPLRSLLEREIDFEAIAASPHLKVFVSATHVNTGRAVIFSGDKLDARAVTASACLPMLFRAVNIDGEDYWDGGYSVNPPLTPLIGHCTSSDIMLVQINPLRQEHTPQKPAEILDRINELTFNASLLTQMRSIDFINTLLAQGHVKPEVARQVLLHRIDGGEAIKDYPASTKSSTDAAMIRTLFEIGQERTRYWLAHHFDAIGQRSTVDIRRDYLDDTRMDVSVAQPRRRRLTRPFQPWLARVFKRTHPPASGS